MVQNDDNIPPADVPALFAEITALLEDAHEITVLGQNSKLGRADHLDPTGELRRTLGLIQSRAETLRGALR